MRVYLKMLILSRNMLLHADESGDTSLLVVSLHIFQQLLPSKAMITIILNAWFYAVFDVHLNITSVGSVGKIPLAEWLLNGDSHFMDSSHLRYMKLNQSSTTMGLGDCAKSAEPLDISEHVEVTKKIQKVSSLAYIWILVQLWWGFPILNQVGGSIVPY